MPAKKTTKTTTRTVAIHEWVGVLAPRPVGGGKGAPDTLYWQEADGPILGVLEGRPAEILIDAPQHLLRTLRQASQNSRRPPSRIRVASPDLANALRKAVPSTIEVVCAPTPALASMRASAAREERDVSESFGSLGVAVDEAASLFRAAADLHRARRWDMLANDRSLLSITIESLDVRRAALAIVGQDGKDPGFVLLQGEPNADAYLDALDQMTRGERPATEVLALGFARLAALPRSLRREREKHGWEIASNDAYPKLTYQDGHDRDHHDEGEGFQAPTQDEVTLADAIARALVALCAEHPSPLAALREGTPFERTLLVKAADQTIEVKLRGPFVSKAPARRYRAPYPVLAHLPSLVPPAVDAPLREHGVWSDELAQRCGESPEANAIRSRFPRFSVARDAGERFGVSIPHLTAAQLREALFATIPRDRTMDGARVRLLIEETRVFYLFLKRACALPQAEECLRVLGEETVMLLEVAIANHRRIGRVLR